MSAEVRTRMSIGGRYLKGRSPEQLANVHLREVLSTDRLVGSGNPFLKLLFRPRLSRRSKSLPRPRQIICKKWPLSQPPTGEQAHSDNSHDSRRYHFV